MSCAHGDRHQQRIVGEKIGECGEKNCSSLHSSIFTPSILGATKSFRYQVATTDDLVVVQYLAGHP